MDTLWLLPVFLAAIWVHWPIVMSGIVAFTIDAYQRYWGKPRKRHWFFSIAVLCLFFACFLAWTDSVPGLQIEVLREIPIRAAQKPDYYQMFLDIKITNAGAAASVTNYHVSLVAQSEHQDAVIMGFDNTVVSTSDGNPSGSFEGFTPIDVKTLKPVPHNKTVRGWLRAAFRNPSGQLLSMGTIVVQIDDANGRTYTAPELVADAEVGDGTPFPGEEERSLPNLNSRPRK